jgi:O-antigen ligase
MAVIAIGFSALMIYYIPYFEMDPLLARTDEEANVAYRAHIYREYLAYGWQEPIWGWGSKEQPSLPGIKSIDNQYLFLFLQYGLAALALYVTMFGTIAIRLIKKGWRARKIAFPESAFAFTLFGVIFSFAVSFLTVYMGLQLEPLTFLFFGWAQGLVETNISRK